MTGLDAMRVIAELEQSVDVGGARHADFEVWPVVRLMVWRGLAPAPVRAGTRRNRVLDLSNPARQLAAASGLTRAGSQADVVMLDQASSWRSAGDGSYVDVFASPIRAALVEQARTMDLWHWSDIPMPRPARDAGVSMDVVLAAAAARARARRLLGLGVTELQRALSPMLAEAATLGVSLSMPEAVERVLAVDAIGRSVARLFGSAPPKLGAVMCFYGLAGLGFTLGCRRRGVLSVDIQHGVQGPGHTAYGPWLGQPGPRSALIPDAFMCWSLADAGWIDRTFGPRRAAVSGNLQLSHDVAERPSERREREVVVTLQPGVEVPEALLVAVRSSPAAWRWWVRPHPTTDPLAVSGALPPDIAAIANITDAARLPLVNLLRTADAHVTAFSSVVLEATALGVPSFLTDGSAADLFPDQIAAGAATVVQSADELLRGIWATKRLPIAAAEGSVADALRVLLAMSPP